MRIDKRAIFALVTVVLLGLFLGVSWMLLPEKDPQVSKSAIELVREQYESELMAVAGVVGVGIGECQGQPCIKVYLADESSNLRPEIPTQLNGYPVSTEVLGKIEALPQP